ncbi:MAG TPA: hypothetical protein VGH49_09325 [Xanthobacteraceae bacterium]
MYHPPGTAKRWKPARAATYGLLASVLVIVVHVVEIRIGARPPDPWLDVHSVAPIEFLSYWGGRLVAVPILFVLIAIVRNAFVKTAD